MTATDSVLDPRAKGPDLPWHLTGNRAPVFEERTETDLEVTGSIPSDLSGRFFRNGANPQTGWSDHWFIGDGMVHGVELSNGTANWYRNRYVRTPMFASPGADRLTLSMNPETFEMDYNVSAANTHVIAHAGRILALEEGAYPYELTPELDTVGPVTFDGRLKSSFTAHPKRCPETGELLAFGYNFLPPHLTYYRLSPEGEFVQSTEISVGGPTMIHDFAISRNHAVFMDLPAVFDMDVAMNGGMPIAWSDDYPARFGIMPRNGTDAEVQWFDVEPCYVFHTLNAYEDGNTVVVRGCRIPELWREGTAMDPDPDAEPGEDAPRMHEWRFDLASGSVSERSLDDQPSEFPRVPDSRLGLPNRYGYTMGFAQGGISEMIKYDLEADSKTVHRLPKGHEIGEPVFVAAEGATNEDDGYLMNFVYTPETDSSHLAIFDASNMAADPLAKIHLPVRVPAGFHGSWIGDAELG